MLKTETAGAVTALSLFCVYLAWGLNTPLIGAAFLVLSMSCGAYALLRGALEKQWPILLLIAALLVISLGSPSDSWDARSIWLFHGKRIFLDQSLSAQLDGYARWSQIDYPVFVPVVMASLAELIGGWNEILPKSAVVWIMLPALLIIFSRLGAVYQRMAMACLTLLCGSIWLVNGYMDGLLGVYFVAGFCVAYWWVGPAGTEAGMDTLRPWLRGATTFSILAILALLKNEGVVLLACVCASIGMVFLLKNRRLPPWSLIALCVLSLLPIVLWKAAVATHGIKSELASSNLLEFFLGRWRNAYFHLLILRTMVWRVEFVVPLVMLLVSWRGLRRDMHAQSAILAAGLYFLIIYLVYLATPNDIRWHLATSADRTILPVCMLLSYAGLSRLGPMYWSGLCARLTAARSTVRIS